MKNYLLIFVFLIAGCASPVEDSSRAILGKPLPIATLIPGSDRYENANPEFAGLDVQPEQNGKDVKDKNENDGVINSLRKQARDSLCIVTSDLTIEYSALQAEQSQSASIVRIIDAKLLQDFFGQYVKPAPGGKSTALLCWARVEWSTGHESDVDLYLLIDSDDNLRVRWDNIKNVKNP